MKPYTFGGWGADGSWHTIILIAYSLAWTLRGMVKISQGGSSVSEYEWAWVNVSGCKGMSEFKATGRHGCLVET